MPQGPYLRKYGVETTIPFVLFEVDGVDFRVDAADGGSDCSIMKDEGAEATCTNDFTDEGQGYSIVLTATEMQAARIVVYVVDSATKVWLDTALIIDTYGNASAMHAMDFDDAVRGGMTALPNAAAEASGGLYTRGTGAGQVNQDGNGRLDANVAAISGDAAAADKLEAWMDGFTTGSVSDASPAATDFDSDLTEATDNHYRNALLLFTSGALVGRPAGRISAFTAASNNLAFEPDLEEAPANGDTFVIIPDPRAIWTGDGMYHADTREIEGTAAKSAVNAEVVDVMKTDTITLPGQEAPPLTPTFEEVAGWQHKVLRNRKTQTSTDWKLLADDESTVDAKSTVSDDGTTAIKQEIQSGP
ncbi:MAG: hypothetical protein V3W51_04765 [Candidatus Brocadiales bacterium]